MQNILKYLFCLSSKTFLVAAILIVNFLNLVFNAYLGKELSFEDYGLVTLINAFWYVAFVAYNALYATVNHRTALLAAKKESHIGVNFLAALNKRIILITIIISFIWILLTPQINNFFHINNIYVPLLFTPVIMFGALSATYKGFLHGNLKFKTVGLILLFESIGKLAFAWIFVNLNLNYWVYASIPLSIFLSFLLTYAVINNRKKILVDSNSLHFPKKFYLAALVTGISSIGFLTFDLILVKHFLSPTEAGQYALLSLVGKMVYFFGVLPNSFMITFISRDIGLKQNPKITFYKILISVIFLVTGAFIGLLLFGPILIPGFFGNKSLVILPYITMYSGAIALFSISSTFISYYLARQNYIFPVIGIFMAFVMCLRIIFFHSDIYQITQTIFYVSIASVVLTAMLHLLDEYKLINFKKVWI